jgi:hypothetical protein
MQNLGPRQSEPPPTIAVRTRKSPALALLLCGMLLLGIGVEGHWSGRFQPWLTYGLILAGGAVGLYAVRWLLDRRPRVVINSQGVDVLILDADGLSVHACRTGVVRYNEIVHIECFGKSERSIVALFVTAEALARIPREAMRNGTPVLANELFAGPPIWFDDLMLECSAGEIAAELVARRRGDVGPLTARLKSKSKQ